MKPQALLALGFPRGFEIPSTSHSLWPRRVVPMLWLVGGFFWRGLCAVFLMANGPGGLLWGEELPAQGSLAPEKSSHAKSPSAPGSSDFQKQLQQQLGEAGISEEENPFLSLLQQMREVEVLLGQGQTGARTQKIQQQILADLDRLIAQAQKSVQVPAKLPVKGKPESASASSSQGPSRPSQPKEGVAAQGKPSSGNPPTGSTPEEKAAEDQHLRHLLQQVWGLLPPGQRQQMIETPVEQFLPKYKFLIIEYFRRLTELQTKEK